MEPWEWAKDAGIVGVFIIFTIVIVQIFLKAGANDRKVFLKALASRDHTIKEIAEAFQQTTEKGHDRDREVAAALGENTVILQETKVVLGEVGGVCRDLKKTLNGG